MDIYGNKYRTAEADVVFSNRGFSYKLDCGWAKWPEYLRKSTVVSGCFDCRGNLYVSTRDINNPIIVFDANGNYQQSLGQGLFSDDLHGIFVTPRNTVLCTDKKRHIVREIDADGQLLRDFGVINHPSDTGYEQDVCSWLKREYGIPNDIHFNAAFSPVDGLRTIKRTGAPFNQPAKMIESSTGDFFAADGYGNAAIHKFSADGTLTKTWGNPGNNDGEFRLPHGLWIDRMERLWLADRENSRIQVFSTAGELLAVIKDLIYKPADIWANTENVFVGEVDGGITILDMDMNIVSQLGYENSPLMAHGICGDEQGNLYIQTLNFHKTGNILKLIRV
ncbi:MAG: hypothetical protein Q4B96_03335 [Bacillota bacterium]|nr:hypothetical protein [Bacillota bacterium]